MKIMAISDAQIKGSYYYIYDSNGKKIATLSTTYGKLLGFGIGFLVLEKSNYYYAFDETEKKIDSLSSSQGEFRTASGNYLNLKKGSYIYTFDKNCKKNGFKNSIIQ